MSHDETCRDCGQDWTRHTLRIHSGNFALECGRDPSAGNDPFLRLWLEHQATVARIENIRSEHEAAMKRISVELAQKEATILELRRELQSAKARARPLEEACDGRIKALEAGHQAALSELQKRYDSLVQQLAETAAQNTKAIASLEERLLAACQAGVEGLHEHLQGVESRICLEFTASPPHTGNQDPIDSILEDAAGEQSPETPIEESEDSDDISPEADPPPDEQLGDSETGEMRCAVQGCPGVPTHILHLVFKEGDSEEFPCCTPHTAENREDLLETLKNLNILITDDELKERFSPL